MTFLKSINPVARFVLLVIIWLPVCLAVWYFLAPSLTWPIGLISDWLMVALFPDLIREILQMGVQLDIVTLLPLPAEMAKQLPPGRTGDLVFSINPLIYNYGLPFFTALVIAAPGDPADEDAKWHNWLLGLPWLLAAQVWGVCFDILKTLLFTMGPEITRQMAFSPLGVEMVALCYQLGYLILPSVLPVAIWVIVYRGYLAELVWGRPIDQTGSQDDPKAEDISDR